MLIYKVSEIMKEADGVKVFRMIPQGESLKYKPGQFVMMHLLDKEGQSILKRPYSIASTPDSPYIEFCIKMVNGEFTSKLDKMKKGATIGIQGPFGNMGYDGDKCVFLCGGTGIAPVISMLRDITNKGAKGKFFVFYSAKTKELLVFRKELEEFSKKNPSINVILTLTQETPEGWSGKCGRINEEMLKEFVLSPKDFNWYLCGPLKMTQAMKECILKIGGDEKKVNLEGWG